MEKLRAGVDFIFSSYKRTAAILFIAALTLAIPITITLVGQQQDIRQRASNEDFISRPPPCDSYADIDHDGEVDENDYNDIKDMIEDEEDGEQIDQEKKLRADVNGDSQVDETDRSLIAQYLLGQTNIFPVCSPTTTISPTSTSTCGDGICQNIACLSLDCPALETTNTCPQDCPATPTATPTVIPGQTSINLSLQLSGIGAASSDSARLGINSNPKRPERNVQVKLINAQNQEILSSSGSATYDSTSGVYKGTISLGTNFQSGPYTIKVRMDNTLWKNIPGIQSLVSGTTYSAPQTDLVSGDFNQDNEINLLDYTLMISCLQNRSNCNNSFSMEDVKGFIAFMNVARLRGEI